MTQASVPSGSLGGVSIPAYVERLLSGGAQPVAHAQFQLQGDYEAAVTHGYLSVLHSLLGPLVVPGPLGFELLEVPRSPWSVRTATEQVALRGSVRMVQARGYRIVEVTARYLRIANTSGQHVLYVRVATNPPSTKWVAELVRRHRGSLRRDRGQLILVVLKPERYARQVALQPLLEVWRYDQ